MPKVITQFVKNWVFPNAKNIVQFKTSGYLLLAFGIGKFGPMFTPIFGPILSVSPVYTKCIEIGLNIFSFLIQSSFD